MPRQRQVVNNFGFVKGLVTDASPLTSPENTCRTMYNVVPDIDGSLTFRKGLDYETGKKLTGPFAGRDISTATPWSMANVIRWKNAAPGVTFAVVYFNGFIFFYRELTTGMQTNEQCYASFDLSSIASTANPVSNYDVQMAPTNGYLYITGSGIKPSYIACSATAVLSAPVPITIYERDFSGQNEQNYTPNLRPSTNPTEYAYNLYNRGWLNSQVSSFFTLIGRYPALSDNYQLGYYTESSTGLEKWKADQFLQDQPEQVGSIKGKFVKDITGYGITYSATTPTVNPIVASTATYNGTTFTITVQTQYEHGLIAGNTTRVLAPFEVQVPSGQTAFSGTAAPYIVTKWTNGANTSSTIDGTSTTPFAVTVATVPNTYSFTFTATIVAVRAGSTGQVLSNMETYSAKYANTTFESYALACNAFYAGRVWWAGQDSVRVGSKIYFSQVLDDVSKAGKCYADADPTSRKISEVVDTDGGAISINDIGRAIKMMPIGNTLVVFATNGIWSVFGRQGIFTATDYGQQKVGTQVLIDPNAVVDIGNTLLAWTTSGIYTIGSDGGGGVVAQNISEGKIETFLSTYQSTGYNILSSYDVKKKTAYFMYDDGKALCLDFRVGAFYLHSFRQGSSSTGGSGIVIGGYYHESANIVEERMKFICTDTFQGTLGINFYALTNTSYIDAKLNGNLPVIHEFETSYALPNGASRVGSVNYVYVFNKVQDGVALTLQSRWDFSVAENSNKWSVEQKAYPAFVPPSVEVARSKLRVPGQGLAFTLRFYSSGAPGKVLGWAVDVEANTNAD